MRLYHVPNSSSQRVLWLLEETGEPYELTILGDRQSRLAYTELQAKLAQVRLAAGSPESERAAREALREAIDAVAAALQGQDFLVGDRFTVADLLVASALGFVRKTAELPPEIVRYLDAIEKRPAKHRADALNPPPAAARS